MFWLVVKDDMMRMVTELAVCTLGDWTAQHWWSHEGSGLLPLPKIKRTIAEDDLLSLNRTSSWHFGKKRSWLPSAYSTVESSAPETRWLCVERCSGEPGAAWGIEPRAEASGYTYTGCFFYSFKFLYSCICECL